MLTQKRSSKIQIFYSNHQTWQLKLWSFGSYLPKTKRRKYEMNLTLVWYINSVPFHELKVFAEDSQSVIAFFDGNLCDYCSWKEIWSVITNQVINIK